MLMRLVRGSGVMFVRAVFKGDVQGVGFRAVAKRCADPLHLIGFARNLPDGSVELCAHGPEKEIELLIEQLKARFAIREISIQYLESFTAL